MSPWRGLGARIVTAIESRAARKRLNMRGPIGDFYRRGGNALLYEDLPLGENDRVIDAGGYRGEWTAGVLPRYGCRSEIFEPVPEFAAHCRQLYRRNHRVGVHEAALGGSNRMTTFSLRDNGTSEFLGDSGSSEFEAKVVSVNEIIASLTTHPGPEALEVVLSPIGVLKLNIEGGEYEVLESLLESELLSRIRCLLIQFHRQPPDWEERYGKIRDGLAQTHKCDWCYSMVWEKWSLR